MLKALYINDCQCNFVDNQDQLIFSFESPNQLTFLDIRKLQLASMIKGAWCEFREITYYLSFLHNLNPYAVGRIVNFFRLFDFDSEKLISTLPTDIVESLSIITTQYGNFSLFFIATFEKNNILTQPIKEISSFWRIFEREGIYSISDLTHYTRKELLNIKDIGVKIVYDIEKSLNEKGIHLKEEEER